MAKSGYSVTANIDRLNAHMDRQALTADFADIQPLDKKRPGLNRLQNFGPARDRAVSQQERAKKRSRTSEELVSNPIRTGVHLLTVFCCGPMIVGL